VARTGLHGGPTAAHRLALATTAGALTLVVVGGLVTNTGSALAVPDWPTTFGHHLFTFPWSRMVGGVLYEHSHRLLGAVVGLLTLILAAALWPLRGSLRALGLMAVVAVVVQGVVGGLRVVLVRDGLAILHGSLAQAFVALLALIALKTSPRVTRPLAPVDPASRRMALGAAMLVYGQIVLGALLTHAGQLELHLVGALAVYALVPVAAARLRRTGDPVAAPVARSLLVLLGAQLALGAGSLVARYAPALLPAEALAVSFPVAHRLVGSLILIAAVVLAARTALAVERAPRPDPLVERLA
jgi:cytochrome c oxidase assembly protein subunit 15